jgi:hypothetical protein
MNNQGEYAPENPLSVNNEILPPDTGYRYKKRYRRRHSRWGRIKRLFDRAVSSASVFGVVVVILMSIIIAVFISSGGRCVPSQL